MSRHLRAEWTKATTLRGTGWMLLGIVALAVLVSAAATATVTCDAVRCGQDTTKLALMGIQAGQVVVAVLAVLSIGDEYGTGMIHTTLLALPRRTGMLAAKAAVLSALVLGAAIPAALASWLLGRLILPARGFPPLPPLTDPTTLRAVAGSVLYLVLVALLSLGLATIVRDPAAGVGTVLGVLFLLPILGAMIPDPDWQRWVWKISPMNAGLAIQSTRYLAELPLTPWAGLGVAAAWAAASLATATRLLHTRDA
ncbi:ABC transporter permease [Nonomuraea sp. NPDC050556]|uniref:ABC transporter permease n=1 Tax=Nonomuraea sp. NPDC050556 TaxID=3364369 RepID=UPI003795C226